MSDQRLERVRALMPPDGTDLTEVFGAGGPPISTGGLVKEDATVSFTAPSAETRRIGPDGFREAWADWLEPWQSYRIYYDDLVERGDRVVALVRLRGVTQRDGVEIEHEAAGIFRFDGDQIVELEFSLDRDRAFAD